MPARKDARAHAARRCRHNEGELKGEMIGVRDMARGQEDSKARESVARKRCVAEVSGSSVWQSRKVRARKNQIQVGIQPIRDAERA